MQTLRNAAICQSRCNRRGMSGESWQSHGDIVCDLSSPAASAPFARFDTAWRVSVSDRTSLTKRARRGNSWVNRWE